VFKLGERDHRALEKISATLEEGLAPAQPEEILGLLEINKPRLRQLLDYMLEEGSAVLAPGGIFFGRARCEEARQKLRDYLSTEPGASSGITVSDFNKLSGTSRKFGLPLLQRFEQEGWLVRDGDLRRLKG
jgi:selenocysteine-specific elongation factor